MRIIKEFNSGKAKVLKSRKSNPNPVNLDGITNDFEKFNEAIGLPFNRTTEEPQPMTDYQLEYFQAVQNQHRVIVNKSRKIGATEAAVRILAFNCFDRYAGHDVMIVAGNELRIAKEILIRFSELFEDNSSGYAYVDSEKKYRRDEIIRKVKLGSSPEIEFCNDTRIMAFAALKTGRGQSFRGTDDIACIYVSEAAHTGMRNDAPIMTALEPNLANRDDGDFILESTPNGKRGFFYQTWKSTMNVLKKKYGTTNEKIALEKLKNDNVKLNWYPLRWDYHEGVRCKVLSESYLNLQKQSPNLDFEQEYCCSFTSSYNQAIKTEDLTFKDKNAKDYKPSVNLLKAIGRPYSDPSKFYRH